ncbi:MAG: N-acetylmuramoyl-L-alanine amidase [Deltaproteobacteria bacterium]|nr:N-acetylmuramoyl-L-alanine amidase [Deltaproteobacteria bacterium]
MPSILYHLLLALLAVDQPAEAAPAGPQPTRGTAIIAAGQPFDVGRTVVLWNDDQGFDGYQTRCIDQTGGCCDFDSPRYGTRKGINKRTLAELQDVVSQFVLHFDGCVNSRSCFKSMHNRTRPGGGSGCGLSAHFMIDTDGTIYQTLDLVERAYHAEQENSISVGVEICNRGRYNPNEMHKLPAEWRTRPRRIVVINGARYDAYDFRPEQYESVVALTRTLLRIFPKMKPEVPEENGEVILDTLENPLAFSGIVGHLHVDLDKQKWDPGALDWKRILRALQGFVFPVQIRGFSEVPRTRDELLGARKAAFYGSEERATGFFPLAPGRLWHSGVHLRARSGAPVVAPTRGRLVAARRAERNGSSTSFVLIRHEVEVEGHVIVFFSLLAHLALPPPAANNPVPWMQELMQPARGADRALLASGTVTLLDERVETGDLLGYVGHVNRGAEQGPEVHFEIFTEDKLPGNLDKGFRYLDASADGPIARRAPLVSLLDKNGDAQVTQEELTAVFHGTDQSKRQALRRAVIRHRHEWGDRNDLREFIGLRELSALSEADRKRLYAMAIAPYLFWNDALSEHAGLPKDQIVYSYNPLTFLLTLAARATHVDIPWPREILSDAGMEPRRLSLVPLRDWTEPPATLPAELKLPPLIGRDLGPKRRDQIPLIELESTDHR